MRLLITGQQGQLVTSLRERCRSPRLDIVTAGRPELDLETPGNARQAVLAARPDVVINAAAYTNVDQAEDEPERAFRINAAAAGEIADAAREVGASIVQISTDYVFDGTSAEPYDESASTGPASVYGRSKLEGEERVRFANPDYVIVRTAWIYSPFGRNFVKSMMSLAHSRDTIAVVADQRGNPTSALDLADGLLRLVESLADGTSSGLGETYHLAGSEVTDWCSFAGHIFAQCDRLGLPSAQPQPILSSQWPTKASRPANSTLDSTKFAEQFGYQMPDWRLSVSTVVERIGSNM